MPTIVVKGRDSQITSGNKQHAEEKIAKLEKYFDGIEKIEAILGHSGVVADVELVISVRRGNPIVCHSRDKDLYAAIDIALDKAEVQLTKHKERLKTHKGRVASGGPTDGSLEETTRADEGLESYDDVIEKREF
jgi:ribosome hibernation promoting factor